MRILKKIFNGLLILALLYGAVLVAERLTTQELTRATQPATQEAVCLMWQPRLLRGDDRCYLNLLNPQGKVVASAPLAILDTGFNALQQFGQLGFQDQDITVSHLRTGETSHRFVVHDNSLSPK